MFNGYLRNLNCSEASSLLISSPVILELYQRNTVLLILGLTILVGFKSYFVLVDFFLLTT